MSDTSAPSPSTSPATTPAQSPAPSGPGGMVPPPFVPKSLIWSIIYVFSSLTLGITQGLGLNLMTSNLQGLQASFGATLVEMGWLPAAYFATNLAGTVLVFKMRTQFGLRRVAEVGIIIYVLVVAAHLLVHDLQTAIVVRAIMGIATAPLSTLAFFYMLEWLPPAKKMNVGICFGLIGSSLSLPLSRVISPDLLQTGDWQGLYALETGLALVSLAIVFLVPLVPPPRAKVFDKDDLMSFPLMTVGLGCIAIVLSMGRSYWWFEAPWLGVLLAVGIGSLTLFCLIEWHRKNPIVDLRWLSGGDMVLFAGSLLLFRMLLSEQSVGVFGLFTTLNLQNDQLIPLFGIIGVATFAATCALSIWLKVPRVPYIHLIALTLIAIASFLDAQSTVLSRPEQFYLSQALIGVASGLFLPPAMLVGFMKALSRGPQYILSFLAVFLTTQSLGGLLGAATFGTFVTVREQFHSNVLAEGITLLDPLVAQRVQAYGAAYSRVLTDSAQRDARGLALLGQSISQQSYVLAYNDLFQLIFMLTLVAMAALATHIVVAALTKPTAPAPAVAA